MQDILAITKALADENRLRALMLLLDGELCACQVIEVLGLAPSTVSKHMAILRQAGLISVRKEGRWMHFSLPGRGASPAVKEALSFVKKHCPQTESIEKDRQALDKVLSIDKESLCKRQTKK